MYSMNKHQIKSQYKKETASPQGTLALVLEPGKSNADIPQAKEGDHGQTTDD